MGQSIECTEHPLRVDGLEAHITYIELRLHVDQKQGAVPSILQRLGVPATQILQRVEAKLNTQPRVSGGAG